MSLAPPEWGVDVELFGWEWRSEEAIPKIMNSPPLQEMHWSDRLQAELIILEAIQISKPPHAHSPSKAEASPRQSSAPSSPQEWTGDTSSQSSEIGIATPASTTDNVQEDVQQRPGKNQWRLEDLQQLREDFRRCKLRL